MNSNFDPFAGCLALIEALGRAERCRLVDRVMADMGGQAPVPEFEDIRDDAAFWCSTVPVKTRAIYADQILVSMTLAERLTFIEWMRARVDQLKMTEGQKAEPEGG